MRRWLFLLSLFVSLVACGGKGAAVGGNAKPDLDGDPYALLPASAVFLANVDARAVFASGSIGAPVAGVTGLLLPIGDDAGLQPSRDIDRVVLGGYETAGLDIAAVATGHFEPEKMALATKAKNGSAIVKGTYAGFPTYAIGPVMYSPLTPKTLVAGTGDGVRRVLERAQQGKLERAMPPWAVDVLETKGAQVAVTADFASQPVASAALASVPLPLPWIKAIRVAKVVGNLQPPGINVAARLTYADPQQAAGAADGVRSVDRWLTLLSSVLGGLRLQNLEVAAEDSDVQCKFAVDDQGMRALLSMAPRFLPAIAQ